MRTRAEQSAAPERPTAEASPLDLEAELRRCHAESYGWALSCCRWDAAEAEDVLQLACLKVLDGSARFQGRASFRSFFLGVVRRTASERRRRDLRRRLAWLRKAPPTWETRPGEDSARDHQLLREALCSLPNRQREVLHLVFYQDLSIREAAVVMEIGIGSARQHYERGKRKLRERLGTGEIT